MSRDHYRWKRHSYFKRKRPNNIPAIFLPNPEGGFTVRQTEIGLCCIFSADKTRSVFLEPRLSEGIFQWVTKIKYAVKGWSEFRFGASIPRLLPTWHSEIICQGKPGGVYAFAFRRSSSFSDGKYSADLCGVEVDKDKDNTDGSKTCPSSAVHVHIDNDATITVELDCTAHTLYFFVDGKRLTSAISDIRLPVHLGASVTHLQTFTTLSFRRIPSFTYLPSFAECVFFKGY